MRGTVAMILLFACSHSDKLTTSRSELPAEHADNTPAATPHDVLQTHLLSPVAKAKQVITALVQGPQRVAIMIGSEHWITVGDRGFVDDPITARSLAASRDKFSGETVTPAWGRTPLIAGSRPVVARAAATSVITAPGAVGRVVAMGEHAEVWQYSSGDSVRIAIVDDHDKITVIPALRSIGQPVPGIAPGMCDGPTVWRIAQAGGDVAAIVMECNVETPLRMQTIHAGGAITLRTLAAVGKSHLEPNQFAVTADGTPILAATLGGKLALARANAAGEWEVTETKIPCVEAQRLVIADDGALWTLTIGAGPDDHDQWTIARDGVRVEVRDPSGSLLVPFELAFDATLGVVAMAKLRDGDAPQWLFAQHALKAIVDLPW